MNDIKYVIMIPKGMNIHGARAIIFNGIFNHKDIAHISVVARVGKVHSAGFVSFSEEGIKCFGSSDSLGVGCKTGDAAIVERTLTGTHGIMDMLAYN